MSHQPSQLLLVIFCVLLLTCTFPSGSSGNKLRKMIQKRRAGEKLTASVSESKANEFLNSLKRSKRHLWDRSRDDVQQWYQQFIDMGFSEAKFEEAVAHWRSVYQDATQNDYHRYYNHHIMMGIPPLGPYYSQSMRHGLMLIMMILKQQYTGRKYYNV
ncbi:augurin-like [Pristis pectinata]|uniref:augurin-like n=1 Tax=Pristis pectinata TaxID=685728 RepID=UPI00223DF274|nr:augurin-like [Pristis pectinata]